MGEKTVQLAEQYDGEPLRYPHWMEPKLDGLRGLAFITEGKVQFKSRNDKPYFNTAYLEQDITSLGVTNGVFDGEILAAVGAKGVAAWGDTASICRSQKVHPDAGKLVFIIFDVLSKLNWDTGNSDYTQEERRDALEHMLGVTGESDRYGLIIPGRPHLRISTREWVTAKEEVMALAQKYRDMGYEGGMLKDPRAYYRRQRGRAWRKVKFVDTHDCIILGAIEGTNRLVGSLGALVIDADGVETKVGTGFTDAQRAEIWTMHQRGELIGKMVEVVAQEVTDEGKYRFPVFMRLRDDK